MKILIADRTDGELLHIGNSNEEICIKNLVKKIAFVMNKDITIKELPPTPGSSKRRCPNIEKVVKLTGYKPLISLDEGLARTYKWYRTIDCQKC